MPDLCPLSASEIKVAEYFVIVSRNQKQAVLAFHERSYILYLMVNRGIETFFCNKKFLTIHDVCLSSLQKFFRVLRLTFSYYYKFSVLKSSAYRLKFHLI